MAYMLKTDLLVYPHFYSPAGNKGLPRFSEIVDGLFKTDLDIVGLGSFQGMQEFDQRWFDYIKQLPDLGERYESVNKDNRFLLIRDVDSGKRLILLNTQVVRAYDGERPVDVSIIGAPDLIRPSRPVQETLEEGRKYGALNLLNRVNSSRGVSLEKAIRFREELADGFSVIAEDDKERNDEFVNALVKKKMSPVAVSGTHHYSLAGKSYIHIPDNFGSGFDFDLFTLRIEAQQFQPHYGEVSRWQRFWTRDYHIIKSGPMRILSGGFKKREFLKVTGLSK